MEAALLKARSLLKEEQDATETVMRQLRKYRSDRYCQALDYAKRGECLGWEYKSAHGLFGVPEFKAHEKVNTLLGEHRGLHLAIEIISGSKTL